MSKDNEISQNYRISEETAIMLIKEGHKLLPANRGENYRKKLYAHLNRIVRPRVEEGTWKKRFNSPDTNIPKKQSDELIPIMVESIMFIVQLYRNESQIIQAKRRDIVDSCDVLIKSYQEE